MKTQAKKNSLSIEFSCSPKWKRPGKLATIMATNFPIVPFFLKDTSVKRRAQFTRGIRTLKNVLISRVFECARFIYVTGLYFFFFGIHCRGELFLFTLHRALCEGWSGLTLFFFFIGLFFVGLWEEDILEGHWKLWRGLGCDLLKFFSTIRKILRLCAQVNLFLS